MNSLHKDPLADYDMTRSYLQLRRRRRYQRPPKDEVESIRQIDLGIELTLYVLAFVICAIYLISTSIR